MCTALKPEEFSAASASSGNREFSSTSFACGAISRSAKARIAARNSSCSSGSLYTSKSGFPAHVTITASSLLAGNFIVQLLQSRILGPDGLRQLLLECDDAGAQPRVSGA